MSQRTSSERRSEQYSLAKILGIWALAAAPMGILSWIVFPLLAPDSESDPLGFGVTRLVLLALGLVWLFVLSMIIVHREEGDLRWATVKRQAQAQHPAGASDRRTPARLWLWVVPFLVAVAVVEHRLNSPLENVWVSVVSVLCGTRRLQLDAIFESQEILARLKGAWWFFALFVIQAAFNTILGRSSSFGGCCCPRWKACSDAGAGWQTACSSVCTTCTSPGGYRTLSSPVSLYTFPAYRFGARGCPSSSTLHRVRTCLPGARGRVGVSFASTIERSV